jgi:hypothetical protein
LSAGIDIEFCKTPNRNSGGFKVDEFVIPEEERSGKAVHHDSYFDLIGRLSHQSVVKHFDAYADIEWDKP